MSESREVRSLNPMRQIVIEVLNEGRRWNHVHGMMQIDVTHTRRLLASIRQRGGEPPSLTGFLIFCLAHALNGHKAVHALRRGRKIFIYDDVDVETLIEREVAGGEVVPTTVIVRSANTRNLKEINAEIRAARDRLFDGSVLGSDSQSRRTNLFLKLPSVLRKPLWWWTRMSPSFRKKNMGTALVTSIGMFARDFDALWPVPLAPWPVILSVGTLSKRLVRSQDGETSDHEFLNMTLTIDHDVVDGAPALRFLVDLRRMLESGYGLEGC